MISSSSRSSSSSKSSSKFSSAIAIFSAYCWLIFLGVYLLLLEATARPLTEVFLLAATALLFFATAFFLALWLATLCFGGGFFPFAGGG